MLLVIKIMFAVWLLALLAVVALLGWRVSEDDDNQDDGWGNF